MVASLVGKVVANWVCLAAGKHVGTLGGRIEHDDRGRREFKLFHCQTENDSRSIDKSSPF